MGCQVQKAMLLSLLADLGGRGFRLRQFQHLSVGKSIAVEFSNAFDFLSRTGQQGEILAIFEPSSPTVADPRLQSVGPSTCCLT